MMIPFQLELTVQDIKNQLTEISQRQPKSRQVKYTDVETLLCYGLFYILDPHKYGGRNIDAISPIAKALAAFFCRTPNSITSKMLNLDGSRANGASGEPLLFALLSNDPTLYHTLYKDILTTARTLSIGEEILPDFLNALEDNPQITNDLLGQDDLPISNADLLASEEEVMKKLDQSFELGDQLTEKMAERKIRLAQHRFALEVIRNCGRACVFCGFEPRTLPSRSGLLRASHIKPWARSDHRERVDIRNGLAACPMHDAAFDQGYLTIQDDYRIQKAKILEESLAYDPGVHLYFGEALRPSLLLPSNAKRPHTIYLTYHYENIFKREM